MKKILFTLIVIFGLGAGVHAQDFSFGAGLGFTGGGLGISVPLEIGLMSFGEGLGLSLRADVGVVFGQTPALTANLSPLVTYTLSLADALPITLYAGPSLRLFMQDAFGSARTTTWSFLGGLAGVTASVGPLGVFAEANLSVLVGTPVFNVQAGLRF
jgi:hypothetical protein